MEIATCEARCGRHWLQRRFVLVVLLIAGLLGMHALVGGPAAASAAAMTSPAHASPWSPGMTGVTTTASLSSGPHGIAHGSGGCADAMISGSGSACVSAPTAKSTPALPARSAASLPALLPAAALLPLSETPRRFALTHLELSIYRT